MVLLLLLVAVAVIVGVTVGRGAAHGRHAPGRPAYAVEPMQSGRFLLGLVLVLAAWAGLWLAVLG